MSQGLQFARILKLPNKSLSQHGFGFSKFDDEFVTFNTEDNVFVVSVKALIDRALNAIDNHTLWIKGVLSITDATDFWRTTNLHPRKVPTRTSLRRSSFKDTQEVKVGRKRTYSISIYEQRRRGRPSKIEGTASQVHERPSLKVSDEDVADFSEGVVPRRRKTVSKMNIDDTVIGMEKKKSQSDSQSQNTSQLLRIIGQNLASRPSANDFEVKTEGDDLNSEESSLKITTRPKKDTKILSISDFVPKTSLLMLQCNHSTHKFGASLLSPVMEDGIQHIYSIVRDGDVWITTFHRSMAENLVPERLKLEVSLGYELFKLQENIDSVPYVNLNPHYAQDDEIFNLSINLRTPVIGLAQTTFGSCNILIECLTNIIILWCISANATPHCIKVIQLPCQSGPSDFSLKQELDDVVPDSTCANLSLWLSDVSNLSWMECVTCLEVVSKETEQGQLYFLFLGMSSGRICLVVLSIHAKAVPSVTLLKFMWIRSEYTLMAVQSMIVQELVDEEFLTHTISEAPEMLWLLTLSGSTLRAWKVDIGEDPIVIDQWTCTESNPIPTPMRGLCTYITKDSCLGIRVCDARTNVYQCVLKRGPEAWTRVPKCQSFGFTTMLAPWSELEFQETHDSIIMSSVPDSQKNVLTSSTLTSVFRSFFGTMLISSHSINFLSDVCLSLNTTNPYREFLGMALVALRQNSHAAKIYSRYLTTLRFPICGRREPNPSILDPVAHQRNEIQSREDNTIVWTPNSLHAIIRKALREKQSNKNPSGGEVRALLLNAVRSKFCPSGLLGHDLTDFAVALTCILWCHESLLKILGHIDCIEHHDIHELLAQVIQGCFSLYLDSRESLRTLPIDYYPIRLQLDILNKFFDLSRFIFALRGMSFKIPAGIVTVNNQLTAVDLIHDVHEFDLFALIFFSKLLLATFLFTEGSDDLRNPSVSALFSLPPRLTAYECQIQSRCQDYARFSDMIRDADIMDTPLGSHQEMEKPKYTLESFLAPEPKCDMRKPHWCKLTLFKASITIFSSCRLSALYDICSAMCCMDTEEHMSLLFRFCGMV